MNNDLLNNLQTYLEKDKFSTSEWEKRGLNPSSVEICELLAHNINETCKKIIQAHQDNRGQKEFIKILNTGLKSINKSLLDTEEKEFICECYHELGSKVGVNMRDKLNSFIYGAALGTMLKIGNAIKGPEKIVDTLSQNCTKCDALLETFIIEKREGIPGYSYEIVRCKGCNEFNMMDHGPNIAAFKFGEYDFVERLRKDEYTKQQAEERLEQIKYWRK